MTKYRYSPFLVFALLLVLACLVSGLVIYLSLRATPVSTPVAIETPTSTPTSGPSPTLEAIPTQPSAPTSTPTETATPPSTSTPRPAKEAAPILTPTVTPSPTSIPQVIVSTEDLLADIEISVRDRLDLARRFNLSEEPIPVVVNATPPAYQVGDHEVFWVGEGDSLRHFQVTAILRYVGPHSYWWIEEGYNVSDSDIVASAQAFENTIYPTDRAFFGSEWSPGVDNDPRVHIFIGNVPNVGGYFYSIHEYSSLLNPYSNEKEMFFININAVRSGSYRLDSILAHEFQHMIHWYNDANEETWVNEGLSELAMVLTGYDTGGSERVFAQSPDTQLNTWGDSPNESIAHYGGSYLFVSYFLERFGEETLRQVVAHPDNGADGFDAVLAAQGQPYRFDDIFADWLVANFLDDPTIGQGLWGYRDVSVDPIALDGQHREFPVDRQSTVSQYAADYIAFEGQGTLTVEFTGTTQVKVVPNQPHSGAYQWWSNRGDDSDMTLTRAFDLSDVDQASLQFWTWYDVEEDWDFAYVEVSTDGGQTWQILPGQTTTTENKSGNSFGHAWTGLSGGGDTPQWIEEQVDLSAYAGQEIQIRFEYVTDDAVNHPGFALDDIAIPAIGYFDDAESGDAGWQANGFARIDNVLEQRYVVQAIQIGTPMDVQRMALDEANHGQLTITGLGDTVNRVVLVIGGVTPFTTEPATYSYHATLHYTTLGAKHRFTSKQTRYAHARTSGI